jgi:ubiquinone/menaquinone biosynthesis C-methylase UbiE
VLSALRRARRRMPLGLRADAAELLDEGDLSPAEIEQNLADLARLNRLLGGSAASIDAIDRLADAGDPPRILDVGTGRGDMPIAFARRGWPTVGLDIHPGVLSIARRETANEPLLEMIEGNARALPFGDASFDVGHCSLLIHHFEPPAAVGVLRELRRVARRGVVINDLRRGVLPLIATGISVAALGRTHVTRRDGMTSARRAYTLDELDALLAEAGLEVRWRSSRWMPRIVTAAAEPIRR